jgi:hypothetical protein
MWKFVLGPVLAGIGYVIGSIYGESVEQVVHKRPAVVYSAVAEAISARAQGGTMRFAEGPQVPYTLTLDRTPGERLVMHLMLDGRQGAEADFTFTPQENGEATLVTARVRADRAVLREALAGTSKARLGYAPDWMLNLTLKPLLRQIGEQIEQGERVSDRGQGFGTEAQLSPEEREQAARWRQYDATRPMVDPDQAARKFLKGGSS